VIWSCALSRSSLHPIKVLIATNTQLHPRQEWIPCETQQLIRLYSFFNVHGSVHLESMSIIVQQDVTMYSLLYFCKLLYMFPVVPPPIIRSTYNCNYNIWYWSNFGKCSVWSQLKMRGMDSSLLPSACSCWKLTASSNYTSNILPRMQNQRLLVQF